jgi:HEAT repeats
VICTKPPYLAGQQSPNPVYRQSRQLARILARRSSPHITRNLVRQQHLVRHLTQYAHSWRIRCLAIKFLDQTSQQRSRSLLVLQGCAKRDNHCDVRYMALEAMLNGWRDHFITLVTLIDRAFDQHRDVQHLAVKALAENWQHHPAALSCLRKISESNASFTVKFVAIAALAPPAIEALQDW